MRKLVIVYDNNKEKVFSCLFENAKAVNKFKDTSDITYVLGARYMGQCVSDNEVDFIVKVDSVDEFFNAIKIRGGQRSDSKNSNISK